MIYRYFSDKTEYNPDTNCWDYTGEITPINAFIVVSEESSNGKVETYCAHGQHSEASTAYINMDCEEITLADYLQATEGLYTPEEYLQGVTV